MESSLQSTRLSFLAESRSCWHRFSFRRMSDNDFERYSGASKVSTSYCQGTVSLERKSMKWANAPSSLVGSDWGPLCGLEPVCAEGCILRLISRESCSESKGAMSEASTSPKSITIGSSMVRSLVAPIWLMVWSMAGRICVSYSSSAYDVPSGCPLPANSKSIRRECIVFSSIVGEY